MGDGAAMAFIPRARRPDKPRRTGLTEIRGPDYATYGQRHLQDVLEVAGRWVDGLKYAGGSFP
jgi:phosphosulfolactate synthase (CoM biosynthesis protein A)